VKLISSTCSHFDWRHICYVWWTCLSTDTTHVLEMPVPSQGHYGFHSFRCWLILSVYIIMSFDFPFVTPFICSNIPATPAYWVHVSQLIRYSRTCGFYLDFLNRGFLLTRNLLNQGLSLRMFYSMVDHYGISKLK
jgi:hypothetical protein